MDPRRAAASARPRGVGAGDHDPARSRSIGVCTIVRGRQGHLRNLLLGLQRQTHPPDVVTVAVMGGPDPRPTGEGVQLPVRWVDARSDASQLPLAAARNAARRAAGAVDDLVFLDADVIPSSTLVADYRQRLLRRPAVWCGQVDYLPPGLIPRQWSEEELDAAATPHPTRPAPRADRPLPKPELFWSLSFAVPAPAYDRIGGFDEAYVGYGAEGTDFGLRVAGAGFGLWRTPRARGWHQHHPTRVPPVHHLADIVVNATVFRRRWGRWPMRGWLVQLQAEGVIEWDRTGTHLAMTDQGRAAHRDAQAEMVEKSESESEPEPESEPARRPLTATP